VRRGKRRGTAARGGNARTLPQVKHRMGMIICRLA
jgi:hypothetical protein